MIRSQIILQKNDWLMMSAEARRERARYRQKYFFTIDKFIILSYIDENNDKEIKLYFGKRYQGNLGSR